MLTLTWEQMQQVALYVTHVSEAKDVAGDTPVTMGAAAPGPRAQMGPHVDLYIHDDTVPQMRVMGDGYMVTAPVGAMNEFVA